VVSVVGTRPEAIKMAPLVRALNRSARIEQRLILTRQHSGLSDCFDLPDEQVSELPFDPRGRSTVRLREMLHHLLCGEFRLAPIDLLLVHGDTASAMAAALAARGCGIPIGHVEAGLRSFDMKQPSPEEGYRVAIDAMAEILFAPSQSAAENLRRDWRAKGEILVTGNTGIDALLDACGRIGDVDADATDRKLILVTCHRRENQGDPIRAVCAAMKRLVEELPVRIAAPLHPNRHARAAMEEELRDLDHIQLLDPLNYQPMVRLLLRSWLILTDSGGLQEEGPALGKPVLVLRNVTERPEALATGNIQLVGTNPDEILRSVAELLHDKDRYSCMSRPAFPFGDGRASIRIVSAIEAWLARRDLRAA
jgi:UDP-N-acetylglucosamine 2-epimerase